MTSNSRAYYAIVSRLKGAGLPFQSVIPGEQRGDCDLIITTSEESWPFGERVVALESLSEDLEVFKGQVLSRLTMGCETMLIGVDPGLRIGVAVFYGEAPLAFNTLWSVGTLRSRVWEFVRAIPARKAVVRVGTGNLELALKIARALNDEVPEAVVEMVDEAGTSARGSKMKGLQGDQSAAAKIAFRKGVLFSFDGPRNQR